MSREDLIQICGPADGIRLFNTMKGRWDIKIALLSSQSQQHWAGQTLFCCVSILAKYCGWFCKLLVFCAVATVDAHFVFGKMGTGVGKFSSELLCVVQRALFTLFLALGFASQATYMLPYLTGSVQGPKRYNCPVFTSKPRLKKSEQNKSSGLSKRTLTDLSQTWPEQNRPITFIQVLKFSVVESCYYCTFYLVREWLCSHFPGVFSPVLPSMCVSSRPEINLPSSPGLETVSAPAVWFLLYVHVHSVATLRAV